ncbi:thioredoxin [Wolbachia endosymbiont of Armadillidium vulgare str. wVulC]|uniref:Thioredoxin n=1 Tax=Wolbachia endosymbiont of Armadillidium arcangelii TaxID=3158571 RepID=A0AAU7Q1D1_9RICK|nr:thioredoxin [Wolbachia endosymbiont of Armadillidium vulgare]KLT22503.1 thioredoxin [Wolbachia endosymbiont of Armadillidium vulgare str. wVulC]OJH32871.1 Thioredoxin-1 [Wolbachia endosymbiont of Armadillidium vulgare]
MSDDIKAVNDQNFKSEVTDYKGLVLVDFWAEWCGPCKSLMPRIEQLAKDRKGKIKICKFDIDGETEVPSKYGVQSIPTLIIFQDGKEIARKIGAPNDLQSWVDSEISE